MRYIKRVSKVKNDDTKGYIINSTNVVDKEKNTYSANVIDGLVGGLIKSKTISGTTSAYGNITTGLDKTKYIPFVANANHDNAFVNFYSYVGSPNWAAHFNAVGSGETLTNTEFTKVVVYYMEI